MIMNSWVQHRTLCGQQGTPFVNAVLEGETGKKGNHFLCHIY